MGFFEYIRCEYPLPEGCPVEGWQTKDTPSYERTKHTPSRETYTITEDVRLRYMGDDVNDFQGEIRFHRYITVWGPLVEFSALFDGGRLVSLKKIAPGAANTEDGGAQP